MVVISQGLNWDLTFVRRALAGDSAMRLVTLVPMSGGWRELESGRARGAPEPADLHGQAAVVRRVASRAISARRWTWRSMTFVRGGRRPAGAGRQSARARAALRGGRLGAELALALDPGRTMPVASPEPAAGISEALAWDDDAGARRRGVARGGAAQRSAPIVPGAGDRVLIGARGGGRRS